VVRVGDHTKTSDGKCISYTPAIPTKKPYHLEEGVKKWLTMHMPLILYPYHLPFKWYLSLDFGLRVAK
jgi:hypothetical protein